MVTVIFLAMLVGFIVLGVRILLAIWDAALLEDMLDLFGDGWKRIVVILGALLTIGLNFIVTILISEQASTGEGEFITGVATALLFPALFGGTLAGASRAIADTQRPSRELLILNWLGIGATHASWASPIGFVVILGVLDAMGYS